MFLFFLCSSNLRSFFDVPLLILSGGKNHDVTTGSSIFLLVVGWGATEPVEFYQTGGGLFNFRGLGVGMDQMSALSAPQLGERGHDPESR